MSRWSDDLLDAITSRSETAFGSSYLNPKINGTPVSETQISNARKAIATAKKYGLDPYDIFAVIDAESSFQTDPGGNGGGIGQFLESTANDYGTSQAELRKNPDKAIDLVGRFMSDNLKAVGGDPTKGVAAYFIGAGTVNDASKLPGDWIDNANKIAASKWGQKPNAVSDYLQSTGKVDASTYNRNKAVGSTTQAGPVSSTSKYDASKPPNPDDYWVDASGYNHVPPGTDGAHFDRTTYEQDTALHNKNANNSLDTYSSYMDTITKSIAADIAARRLTLDEASQEFTKRLSAVTEGGNLLEKFASEGDPVGREYRLGREPGGMWSQIGEHPLDQMRTSGITINPMEIANNLVNGSQDYTSIGSPTSNVTSQLQANAPPPLPPPNSYPPTQSTAVAGGQASPSASRITWPKVPALGSGQEDQGGSSAFQQALALLQQAHPPGALPPDWYRQTQSSAPGAV